MNRRNGSIRCREHKPTLLLVIGLIFAGLSNAQSRLSLEDAIKQAIESRASLKAENERIAAARGLEKQASLRQNPEFLFQNENLRPGQTYTQTTIYKFSAQ